MAEETMSKILRYLLIFRLPEHGFPLIGLVHDTHLCPYSYCTNFGQFDCIKTHPSLKMQLHVLNHDHDFWAGLKDYSFLLPRLQVRFSMLGN